MNWKTFFICGLTGWCMEILFTWLGGLLRGDLLFKRTRRPLDVSDLRDFHRTLFQCACATRPYALRQLFYGAASCSI